MDKRYGTTVFKTLFTSQRRTVITKKRKQTRWALQLPWLIDLRDCSTGRRNWRRHQQNSWVEETKLRVRKEQGNWSSWDRLLERIEVHREKPRDLQRAPLRPGFSTTLISACLWENYMSWAKNWLKRLEETGPGAHPWLGILPIPTSHMEKLKIYGAQGRILKKVLPC